MKKLPNLTFEFLAQIFFGNLQTGLFYMAKKARFYEVTTRDGYGDTTKIYTANKKILLEQTLSTQTTKVVEVKSLGWKSVSVEIDSETEKPMFCAEISGKNVYITNGDLGYKNLTTLFYDKYQSTQQIIHEIQTGEFG